MPPLFLQLRRSCRYQAYEYQLLRTAIANLVQFITGNKCYGTCANGFPLTVLIHLPITGMEKNLMFPFVLMLRCIPFG